MNTLVRFVKFALTEDLIMAFFQTVVAFACLAVFASAKPSGHGVIVAGPSGVVTGHGAVGGWGGWGNGGWGHGGVVGNGAALIAPSASAVVSGPGWGGHGAWGGGLGGWGGAGVWGGHGNGVVVAGPRAGPAVIAGPSGKIVTSGGWGHGGHW